MSSGITLKSPDIIILALFKNSFLIDLLNKVNQFFLYSYFSVSTGFPLGT